MFCWYNICNNMQKVEKIMNILVETDDTSGISSPLKTTNRIKFLSFAASDNYLIFGASSGGLYVYNRESYSFKSLIPGKEGPITCVKISPDEKWFGFSTSRGISCVVEHHGSSINRRILSLVHEGKSITALQWNNTSNQMYIGDSIGQISVISLSSYLTPAAALMQLDSAIVQIDTCKYMLVVSTMTRSYLCDTFREQYRQIGTRLRDGEFGACFYRVDPHEPVFEVGDNTSPGEKDLYGPLSSFGDGEWLLSDRNLTDVKVFCARPGLRLWEVRIDGAVMNTHQFKQLKYTPSSNVIRPPEVEIFNDANHSKHQKDFQQFTKVSFISQKYLVTYNSKTLCVLDPMTSEVILWTNQFVNINTIHIVGGVVYVWMGGSELHAVCLMPIDKFLVRMYLEKNYMYCAKFCAAHVDTVKSLVPISQRIHILSDLLLKIDEKKEGKPLDESILSKLKDLLEELSKNAQNQEQSQMLNSGIYIVGNAHMFSQRQEWENLKGMNLNSLKTKVNESLDICPNSMKNGEFPNRNQRLTGDHSESSVFRNNISPTVLSVSSMLDTQPHVNSDKDFDPFPDLPLSSLSSSETVLAFKNLRTTVSGTISNSKKSLKAKWLNFEEKLRGQEESGLGVGRIVNKFDEDLSAVIALDHTEECDKITSSACKNQPSNLHVSYLIEKCHQLAGQTTYNDEMHQKLLMEMLNCFFALYAEFRQSLTLKPEKKVNNVPELEDNFQKWLDSSDIIPFPFLEYFDDDFVVTFSRHLQATVKSGTLIRWLSQSLTLFELDHGLFPHHISSIYSKECLLLDQAMGRTQMVFCRLLDPSTALQDLEESGIPCHYYSWSVIMDYFQSNTTMASVPNQDESCFQGWPLPRVLNAMLVMLQLDQVDSCWNIGKSVPIKHISRIVLKLGKEQNKIYSLFLSHLERMSVLELEGVLEDPEIDSLTRCAFLSLHQTNKVFACICGQPLYKFKLSKSFRHVGRILLHHIFVSEGISEAFSFCQKTDVLWYNFLILRRTDAVEDVLPLILHIACEEELRHRSRELSPASWDLMLQLKVKLEQGFCLKCNTNLGDSNRSNLMSWMSLASLLVEETSVDFALSLLLKYSNSIPAGQLSLQFYRCCLLASVVEDLDVLFKPNLLEVLTDTDKVPIVSPELAERLCLPSNEGKSHWGLRLNLSKSHCLCCLLPLVPTPWGSVVSFHCHHTFHSVCLPKRVLKLCPVCVKP